MRFHDPLWLFAFFVWGPLLAVYFGVGSRMRTRFAEHFADTQRSAVLSVSPRLIWAKRLLITLVLTFATIAAARPQAGESEINIKSEGIDIAVVFDVSRSMLAEDEDGPRIDAGKQLLIDAITSLSGDRIALVPFAGQAFLQLPLTADYNTALTIVSSLEPGMIQAPGTSLETALELAVSTLASGENTTDRLVVIISDGEDPSLSFDSVREMLEGNNVHLAILPLGTTDGAPVKVGSRYLRDKDGKTVISKINSDFFDKCTAVLNAERITGGTTLAAYIDGFKQKVTREENRIILYEEQYQFPLAAAILLFFIYILLPTGKRRRL